MIHARSFARKAGIIGVINRFRRVGPYEERVHKALIDAIGSGDVVWDVGANIGVYTQLFCEIVGGNGAVVAFEPSPESSQQIRARLPDCAWLRVENVALGDEDREGRLVLREDSVEHHIGSDEHASDESIAVRICRGDSISERLGRVPNVVKVDVEGFEEEVLRGMQQMLGSPTLRVVLVEVHFLKLETRGQPMAPIRIEKMLRSKGFGTTWVDSSHLFARR
jgi:FkbM family methyltransferase